MRAAHSSLIAVDVALVPPEWVQDRARQLNQGLRAGGLRLDETHVPHVSLAQLFLSPGAVPLLVERLNLLLKPVRAIPVSALAIVEQRSVVSLLLDRTPELVALHVRLMDALKEWEEEGGDPSAFYAESEPAREKDVEWVANFRAAASYGNFVPHITLGLGTAPPPIEPFDFTADLVGLFHLGRFCTCRVLLRQWRL
ncbi:MAG TPA: 2'-5' RNA ligase family protein [Terriglobia bacterium]|nr:2'-5' RNA ligase family protein [Terriglobia bacterium]